MRRGQWRGAAGILLWPLSQRKESFVRSPGNKIGVVPAGCGRGPCANHAHTHAHAGHEGVIGPQRQGVFYA